MRITSSWRRLLQSVALSLAILIIFAGALIASPPIRRCLPATEESPLELQQLQRAEQTLLRSALGSYFQKLLATNTINLCWDPLAFSERGYYEPDTKTIAVASGLSQAATTLILAHELRHIDQHARGYELSLYYDMHEYVRQTYALEADAHSFAIYFAWLARSSGDEGLWQEVGMLERYQDLAKAYVDAAKHTETPHEPMRRAFVAWYQSAWRREAYYFAAATRYLDRLDESHAIPASRRFPDTHFDRLCHLPDGTNYGCHLTSEIARRPTGYPFN